MTTIRSDANAGLVIDSDTSGALTFVTGNSNVALQINSGGTIDLSSSRLILPVGSTAARANVLGALRFNNESNVFEAYNGSAWNNVSDLPPPPPVEVEYLVIAGGGSGGQGGSGYEGGGGGAGGLRTSFGSISGGGANAESILSIITNTPYTVTVGAGGGALANGSPSVFFTVSSLGGGRGSSVGGALGTGAPGHGGFSGGSGGGAATPGETAPTPTSFGGSGTANQGYPGGKSWAYNGGPSNIATGGGGGAGQAGQNAAPAVAGAGGNGIPSTISGANVFYAGGGGGGVFSGTTAPGGLGGGGHGGGYYSGGQTPGTVNLGAGGGGSQTTATSGGSGIIILRYPNTYILSNTTPGLSFTTNTAIAGYKITTFTAGTGEIQWS